MLYSPRRMRQWHNVRLLKVEVLVTIYVYTSKIISEHHKYQPIRLQKHTIVTFSDLRLLINIRSTQDDLLQQNVGMEYNFALPITTIVTISISISWIPFLSSYIPSPSVYDVNLTFHTITLDLLLLSMVFS